MKAKTFTIGYGVGKAKYDVMYYDGIRTNKDGSLAAGWKIFSNKLKLKAFTDSLLKQGYTFN